MTETTERTMDERIEHLHFLLAEYSEHSLYVEMAREALLTNLAPRIYALSRSFYMDCGFHYDFETRLGKLIQCFSTIKEPCMNHLDKQWDIWSLWMVDRVIFEGLCEDVIKAEQSISLCKEIYDGAVAQR